MGKMQSSLCYKESVEMWLVDQQTTSLCFNFVGQPHCSLRPLVGRSKDSKKRTDRQEED